MEEENMKYWAAQPDVCRCCLATSGIWDLTALYVNEGGQEVFSEMLQECFGLRLSCLAEWGPSHLVCGPCVDSLRKSVTFKTQVTTAEKHFVAYLNNQRESGLLDDTEVKIKTEIEVEQLDCDDYLDMEPIEDEEPKQRKVRSVKSRKKSAKIKTESVKHTKRRGRKAKVDQTELDETGVADNSNDETDLSTKDDLRTLRPRKAKKLILKETEDLKHDEEEEDILVKRKRPRTSKAGEHWREQRKENDNLRSNITLLLHNSTITPFRYLKEHFYKYTCHYCDSNYTAFNDLKEHNREKHANITEEEVYATVRLLTEFVRADISDIRCKVCEDSFPSIEVLLEHLIENHEKTYYGSVKIKPAYGVLGFNLSLPTFKCHMCDEEFKSFRKLFTHMSEHCESFVCALCGKKFLSAARLQKHEHQHMQVSFKCKFCKKTFSTLGARTYHLRKIHDFGKHKCTECDEQFDHHQQRLDHLVRVHSASKPVFQCEVCSKELANANSLRKHKQNVHLKINEYLCNICDKSFNYKKSLDGHLRWHSGVKNLECKFCNKKFGAPNTLRVHMRGHLNDRRFVCQICNAAFIQKVCLKSHIKTHHPHSGIDLSKMPNQTKSTIMPPNYEVAPQVPSIPTVAYITPMSSGESMAARPSLLIGSNCPLPYVPHKLASVPTLLNSQG